MPNFAISQDPRTKLDRRVDAYRLITHEPTMVAGQPFYQLHCKVYLMDEFNNIIDTPQVRPVDILLTADNTTRVDQAGKKLEIQAPDENGVLPGTGEFHFVKYLLANNLMSEDQFAGSVIAREDALGRFNVNVV